MAKRYNRPPKAKEKPKYFCRDCANSYDWHNKGYYGMVLCRCPHHTGGKYCKLLSDPACDEHFELRTNGEEEQNRQMGGAAQA